MYALSSVRQKELGGNIYEEVNCYAAVIRTDI